MISWLDGPSEGLLLIGRKQGFLPPYSQKVNRQGIEVRIIATEGIVITLIAVLYAFIPRVSHPLGLHRAGHAGVPDHVRADVHRRGQAAPLATGSPRAATEPPPWACCACSAPSRPWPRS
jgi:hypothetical protein